MSTFFTTNRHGYSVRFSPFNPDQFVVASSQFYGLAGGGTLYFLELAPDGNSIVEKRTHHWTDGLFDVTWSESNQEIVVSGSGDGSVQLWNTSLSANNGPPQMVYREHKKEIYSVDWSKVPYEQLFISASWDSTVKIWDPIRSHSLSTYIGHTQLVYNAVFASHIPNTFASVSGDGMLKIWDILCYDLPIASIKAHEGEVLTVDWCKHDSNVLATGASDGLIRIWDLRNFGIPIAELKGNEFAVRKVQFSPHNLSVLASVGYDFTTRIWDFKKTNEAMETIKHHSEFTYGLDWNRRRPNQLADCGWDSLVHVFKPDCLAEKI